MTSPKNQHDQGCYPNLERRDGSSLNRARRIAGAHLMRFAHRRVVEAYCCPPSRSRTRALKSWQRLRTLSSRWLHDFDNHLQRWQGVTAEGNLDVLFLGNWRAFDERSPQYLQRLLFGERPFACQELGELDTPRQTLPAAASADLVILERNRYNRWRPPYGSWLSAPPWVRQVFRIDPAEEWESVLGRLRSQKRNMRLFRRNQLTARIVRGDAAAFDRFYDRMHLPLISSRHGDYGVVSSREVLRDLYRDGLLMEILTLEGQPIAADLLVANNAAVFNVAGGVLDGDRRWYDLGVLSALYYYEIEWAYQSGLRLFDSGESRPMAFDGVFLHKQRWGMEAVADWREPNQWLFWLPRNSPAASRWLEKLNFVDGFYRESRAATAP